jgi:hypothetical protein
MKIEKEGTMRGTRCDALPKVQFSSDNDRRHCRAKVRQKTYLTLCLTLYLTSVSYHLPLIGLINNDEASVNDVGQATMLGKLP